MRPLAVPDELVGPEGLMGEGVEVSEATARLNLALASGAVRSHCGWQLSRGRVEGKRLRLVAGWGGVLWLPTQHLVSVDALAVDGRPALAPTAYAYDEDGRVELAGIWWGARRAVVSYTEGYTDDSYELAAIKGVVLSAAARLCENPTAERSYTIGAEAVVAAGAGEDVISLLAKGERLQLEPYRLVVLA